MFSTDWHRPSSASHPQVWSRFEKTTNDGKTLKFKVQDATEDHYDGILELSMTDFVTDEPWYSNIGFANDPTSLEMISGYMKKNIFPQNVTLVCLLDNEDESKPTIVGFNLLGVCCKSDIEDFSEFVKTESTTTLVMLYGAFKTDCPNVFEKHNVDKYLGAMGLSVKREYRGLNISMEILKARIPLCKAIGISITNTIFTAIASQKTAKKAGFQLDYSVSYDVLRNATGLEFKNCINCEMMTLTVE